MTALVERQFSEGMEKSTLRIARNLLARELTLTDIAQVTVHSI